jgi:hypothetical protein
MTPPMLSWMTAELVALFVAPKSVEIGKERTRAMRYALILLLMMVLVCVPSVGAEAGPSVVPANLAAPAPNVQLLTVHAEGVQLYVCKARADDPQKFEWTFTAPRATLMNAAGEQIGTHYAGPSWEGKDGSKVMGKVVERADAPTPSAIPWLLLEAQAHEGAGAFSTVTYVQRLDTVGGIAPADGCGEATANTERAVEYTATYAFFY